MPMIPEKFVLFWGVGDSEGETIEKNVSTVRNGVEAWYMKSFVLNYSEGNERFVEKRTKFFCTLKINHVDERELLVETDQTSSSQNANNNTSFEWRPKGPNELSVAGYPSGLGDEAEADGVPSVPVGDQPRNIQRLNWTDKPAKLCKAFELWTSRLKSLYIYIDIFIYI